MRIIKYISLLLSGAMLSGCCSTGKIQGANGPELVSSGYSTESGHYAEVGVKFSTTGDFVAMFSPSRWENPIKTGGSLSWMNPVASSDDAGRTGRILLGEAVVVGGVAAAAVASSGGGGDGGSSSGGSTPSGPTTPPPGGGGGGGPGGPPPGP